MSTFVLDLGRGVKCYCECEDEFPEKGKTHIRNIEWSKPPPRNSLRAYIGWMNSVNQTMADKWGKNLMHVYQVDKRKAEIWVYKPNEPMKMKVVNT